MTAPSPPPFSKDQLSYALYLVTDSTPAILGGQDLCDVVERALAGGATCVQYRDKTSDTAELVATASRLHAVTRRHGVPLLINDRLDVALAVGCEGVHIGQDDMELGAARRLLGEDKIIGVTVCNAEETRRACEGGADYVGIGTVFATPTKENTKSIIGVDGLQELLMQIHASGSPTKTVCIGGINASNVERVIWQSAVPLGGNEDFSYKPIDGVAVVSAIVAARDPCAASSELLRLVQRACPPYAAAAKSSSRPSVDDLLRKVPEAIRQTHETKPLSHNMTNLVVQNFAANVALSVGGSPIMANYGEEARDLAALGGALVVNMGTVTPEGLDNYTKALKAYNAVGGPVVYDPVGAGATEIRRNATRMILGAAYIDVIKGNQAEVMTCIRAIERMRPKQQADAPHEQQRGVDSGPSSGDPRQLGLAIRHLARRRRNVVVMTGKTDYVTAGGAVWAVDNGHEYLGNVTGTGCCLGTTISAVVAANRGGDKAAATVAALLHYNIAAELAAERADVKGPGTFVPAFLDELYNVRMATVRGDMAWLARAKVREVDLS